MAKENFGKIIQYIRSWQEHLWLKWSCVTRTTLAILNNLDEHNNRNKLTSCWHYTTLPVEDEYLLLLMKLRMGLTNIDIAERFCITDGTVNNILFTWINYLFVTLGSLKIWPHRNVLLKNSPEEFLEKYPNTLLIIDATELKIQTPSSLQTLGKFQLVQMKCLLGVDPRGGIIFISQLYEGSISDKEIVKRSGFFDILKKTFYRGIISRRCNNGRQRL